MSPSLTYLGLDAAIAPSDSDTLSSTVELPALQRLHITERDTQRIVTALGHISAPNVLESDFTSPDSAWFSPTTGFSPFSNLQETQEVTLTVTEYHTYRWVIECRWGAKHAVRFHFDPTVTMTWYVIEGRDREDQTADLIHALRSSPIFFERIRSLTLRGYFSDANLKNIFSLFPAIGRLSTRHHSSPHDHVVGSGSTVPDILSMEYCPQLRAIDIGTWPELPPSSLLKWVSARSAEEGGCCKLYEVVVTSEKPLPCKERSRIVNMLDRFLWRKSMVPKPSYNGPFMFQPRGQHAPPITEAITTQLAGGGSWDEDEEWARVPCPPGPIPLLPPNSNLSMLDDSTLTYCDRALQGRWDYFAIPGM